MDVNLTQNGAAPGVSYPTTLAAPRRPQVPDPHPAPLYLGSGSDAHMVQFYHDDGFLLDDLGRFFGSALEAGDAAIIIATRPHRGRLARRLKARGLNLSAAAKQGRYVALDAAETLSKIMLDGLPHAARFVKVVGSAIERATELVRADRLRVYAFGEMAALLWAGGMPEAAIELEHLWNDLAHTHSFNLRCAYPMNLFLKAADGAHVAEICALHSHVIPAESYTQLAGDRERLDAIALLQQKAQALETELEERQIIEDALRQALASRDEFLSVAAHELKTPLTGLQGYAQLLLRRMDMQQEVGPERLRSTLTTLEGQAKKLTQLVVRLLDTSQIEAGKLRIEPVATDIIALVDQALERVETRTDHKFVFYAPEHLDAMVDPVRFEQVIRNLMDNAVQFSPEGGVITVDVTQDGEGGFLFAVTDRGVGVPPGQREAIFERFQQAHAQQYLSGMGLGLYITREIVELHGGSIRVEEPGQQGARFVVTIPSLPALIPEI